MPYLLPSQHRFAHDYCIFLHDLMVGKLKGAVAAGVFRVPDTPTPEEIVEISLLKGEGLYRWLEVHRGPEFTEVMDFMLILQRVLEDLCQFVLEALRAAAKGKLTVAYTLLRKPFKDNLFILEWLLADPGDFLVRFRTQSSRHVAVDKVGEERKKEIIAAAIELSESSGPDAEMLYGLRYDRSVAHSLVRSWDKAIHLVTLSPHYTTEQQNFNFVFSDPEADESQWRQIYLTTPLILYHTIHVVDALFDHITSIDAEYESVKKLRRDLGFALVGEDPDEGHHTVLEELRAILTSAAPEQESVFECPGCSLPLRLHRRNLRSLALRGKMRCSTCRQDVLLDGTDVPPATDEPERATPPTPSRGSQSEDRRRSSRRNRSRRPRPDVQ